MKGAARARGGIGCSTSENPPPTPPTRPASARRSRRARQTYRRWPRLSADPARLESQIGPSAVPRAFFLNFVKPALFIEATIVGVCPLIFSKQRETRRYRKRRRAETSCGTRERITEAAVRLHGSIGPPRRRSARSRRRPVVQRATVYRTFRTSRPCSRPVRLTTRRPTLRPTSGLEGDLDPATAATRFGRALRVLERERGHVSRRRRRQAPRRGDDRPSEAMAGDPGIRPPTRSSSAAASVGMPGSGPSLAWSCRPVRATGSRSCADRGVSEVGRGRDGPPWSSPPAVYRSAAWSSATRRGAEDHENGRDR